jgi:type IV secretory pathway VirB10-like protein
VNLYHRGEDAPLRHRRSGNESDIARALQQGASNSTSQIGQQIVRRQLYIAPTLTIRPGFPVRVIVTRDLVLEPYGGRHGEPKTHVPSET